jgi:hypothetical protein
LTCPSVRDGGICHVPLGGNERKRMFESASNRQRLLEWEHR